MPIYEYECPECGAINEFILKFSDPAPTDCPSCNKSVTMKKLMSATNFHLKGGGWFKDQYDSASNRAPANKAGGDGAAKSGGSSSGDDSSSKSSKSDSGASTSDSSSSSSSSSSSGSSSSSSSGSSGGSSGSSASPAKS